MVQEQNGKPSHSVRVDGKGFITPKRYSQLMNKKNIMGLSGVTKLNRPNDTIILTEPLYCEVFDEMLACLSCSMEKRYSDSVAGETVSAVY